MNTTFHFQSDGVEYIAYNVSYTPKCKGVYTLSNGDPGYPDEPAEIDYSSISLAKEPMLDIEEMFARLALRRVLEDFEQSFSEEVMSGELDY